MTQISLAMLILLVVDPEISRHGQRDLLRWACSTIRGRRNDAEALGGLTLHGHDIVPEEIIKEHGQQEVPVPEGEVSNDPEPEETAGSGLPRIPEHGLLEGEDEPTRAARTRDARNRRPKREAKS